MRRFTASLDLRNNMKLISRKALTATIAAAAISTASLTAPAMAADFPTSSEKSNTATTTDNNTKDATAGSSDLFTDKDGQPLGTVDKFKAIVSILTTVGALFGAIITINNNIDRIIKGFMK